MKLNEKIKKGSEVFDTYVQAFNYHVNVMYDQLDTSTAEQTANEVNRLVDIWQAFVSAVRSGVIQFDNVLPEADNDN